MSLIPLLIMALSVALLILTVRDTDRIGVVQAFVNLFRNILFLLGLIFLGRVVLLVTDVGSMNDAVTAVAAALGAIASFGGGLGLWHAQSAVRLRNADRNKQS